jgi:Domain of unknown function (DUF1707)
MRPAVPSGPWGQFTQDPRRSESKPLRASDRDRNVVLGVLTEAYVDGRLTKEEHDERAAAAGAARTLGELPALIEDLVPQRAAGLHERAVERWEAQRRQAVSGFLVPTLICWAIWVALPPEGFLWPLLVMLGTGARLVRVLVLRQDIIAEEQRRLEKRERRALGGPPG